MTVHPASREKRNNRIALAPAFAQTPPMLARDLSAALSAIVLQSATADVNGIEAFPVEVEVNSSWGDTVVVLIMSISPIVKLSLLEPKNTPLSTSLRSDVDTGTVWTEKVRVK
jgi:hypothetical protein